MRYDPSRLTVASMLKAIQECGFTGRESRALEAGQAASVALEQMPPELQALTAEAGTEGKLVLLSFHGAG